MEEQFIQRTIDTTLAYLIPISSALAIISSIYLILFLIGYQTSAWAHIFLEALVLGILGLRGILLWRESV